jgi:hypothetical protein
MSLFQRVVPLALAIFSGVVGGESLRSERIQLSVILTYDKGVYTFKPLFDPAERTSPEAYSMYVLLLTSQNALLTSE